MATRSLADRAQLVRLAARPLPPELTPLLALSAVERDPHTVFLESGGPAGEGARWTLLAFDPVERLEVRGSALWRVSRAGATTEVPGEPMSALAHLWPDRVRYDEGAPTLPFRSG